MGSKTSSLESKDFRLAWERHTDSGQRLMMQFTGNGCWFDERSQQWPDDRPQSLDLCNQLNLVAESLHMFHILQ